MPSGRIRPRWVRRLAPLAVLAVVGSAWGQPPAKRDKMPEVWVGTRRVNYPPAAAPAAVAPTPAATSTPPPRREANVEAPPELKRIPFRRLDPPLPVAPALAAPEVREPMSAAGPVMTASHRTTRMPAASMLPDIPAGPSRAVAAMMPSYTPMASPEPSPAMPVTENTASMASPRQLVDVESAARPPVIVPAPVVHVETTSSESTPLYVTAMAQMVGVLAALSIFCGLGLVAHLVLVRKYGTSLLAPFRVEVVSAGPPAPALPVWTPPPLKELTALERPDDDEPPVQPNFEMPLTYEEEMALRKENEKNQESGVLQFIADMNLQLQEQLKKLPAE